MEHTPIPYHIDRVLTENGAPIIVADTCWRKQPRVVAKAMYHSGSEDPEVEANAEFIVRACNAHDELLAACEAAVALLQSQYQIVLGNYPDYGQWPEIELCNNAISKAKGE